MRREYTVSSQFDVTFCCRIMLTALCVTCSFPPAWAATFVAARTARVPHGPKAACIHGRLACASGRQSRTKAPLREHLFFRSVPPSMPHDHAAGNRHLCSRCPQAPLRPATGTASAGPPVGRPPTVRDSFNTILQQSLTPSTFCCDTANNFYHI